MLFPFDVAPSFFLLGDVLARWSGGLSSRGSQPGGESMVNWNLQNKRKAVAALETCGRCINALILLVYSIFGRLDTRTARLATPARSGAVSGEIRDAGAWRPTVSGFFTPPAGHIDQLIV